MTPEGKVKNQIRRVLDQFKSRLDVYWPVPAGYGPSHLDCIVCAGGYFLAIEAKAPGKKPTARQGSRIGGVTRAGGIAVVVDGTDATVTYDQLHALLETMLNAPRTDFLRPQDDRRTGD